MRHRMLRSRAVLAVVSLAAVVGAAGAFAEGRGNPHIGGESGDPHPDGVRGDPHAAAILVVPEQEPAVAPVEATLEATAPVEADTASSVQVASGKPADGTVGNADDKAPPGQSAGDKNRGYECDANRGIGQGNPAHSGCPQPPKPPVTPPGPVTPPVPVVPPAADTLAVNQPVAVTVPAQVLGVEFTRGPEGAVLARTGVEVAGPVDVALLLVLAGVALLWFSRRCTPAPA